MKKVLNETLDSAAFVAILFEQAIAVGTILFVFGYAINAWGSVISGFVPVTEMAVHMPISAILLAMMLYDVQPGYSLFRMRQGYYMSTMFYSLKLKLGCYTSGMTTEQAISELAKHSANFRRAGNKHAVQLVEAKLRKILASGYEVEALDAEQSILRLKQQLEATTDPRMQQLLKDQIAMLVASEVAKAKPTRDQDTIH